MKNNDASEEAKKLFDEMVGYLTSAEGVKWAEEELPILEENRRTFLERIGRLPEQCGGCKRFTGRRKKFESSVVVDQTGQKMKQSHCPPTEE